MRQVFGWLIFFIGVLGLGYWAQESHAKSIENIVRANAAAIDVVAENDVVVSVLGRDITLSGDIANDETRALILDQMTEIEGRRMIHDNMELTAQN